MSSFNIKHFARVILENGSVCATFLEQFNVVMTGRKLQGGNL